jgi:hypothetical protein
VDTEPRFGRNLKGIRRRFQGFVATRNRTGEGGAQAETDDAAGEDLGYLATALLGS